MRVAVIGDVSGWPDELYTELLRLGCDPNPERWTTNGWPDDLTVIQVGDLVDTGPRSEDVLELVDHTPRNRWIQLVGNHEARYLGGPDFNVPRYHVVDKLRDWDRRGGLHAAAHIRYDNPDTHGIVDAVVTHAGVTANWAAQHTGTSASDAATIVEHCNALWANGSRARRAKLWRLGAMLGHPKLGTVNDSLAGPLWASAAREVWPSWADQAMPYTQIHGHSAIRIWAAGRSAHGVDELCETLEFDNERRHARWRPQPGGGELVAIDPMHQHNTTAPHWEAFVVNGTASTSR